MQKNHRSEASLKSQWAAWLPPMAALSGSEAFHRLLDGDPSALQALEGPLQRQLQTLCRLLSGLNRAPTTPEATVALLQGHRRELTALSRLLRSFTLAEALRALAILPGSPTAEGLLALLQDFRRREAQRAYTAELLWLLCALVNALTVGGGFQVPDWFSLFGGGDIPAEGSADAAQVLQQLKGRVTADG